MKIKILLSFFCFFNCINLMGQDAKTKKQSPYLAIQAAYNTGIGNVSGLGANSGQLYRLRLSGGINFDSRIYAGIGYGLEAYHNPGFNFMPIVIEGRYFLNSHSRSLFLSGGLGYLIPAGPEFNSGTYFHAGVGYRFYKGNSSSALFSFGHEWHQANVDFDEIRNLWLRSLSFSITYVFE